MSSVLAHKARWGQHSWRLVSKAIHPSKVGTKEASAVLKSRAVDHAQVARVQAKTALMLNRSIKKKQKTWRGLIAASHDLQTKLAAVMHSSPGRVKKPASKKARAMLQRLKVLRLREKHVLRTLAADYRLRNKSLRSAKKALKAARAQSDRSTPHKMHAVYASAAAAYRSSAGNKQRHVVSYGSATALQRQIVSVARNTVKHAFRPNNAALRVLRRGTNRMRKDLWSKIYAQKKRASAVRANKAWMRRVSREMIKNEAQKSGKPSKAWMRRVVRKAKKGGNTKRPTKSWMRHV